MTTVDVEGLTRALVRVASDWVGTPRPLVAERDYFWSLLTEEKYAVESIPQHFTLGQISESAKWLTMHRDQGEFDSSDLKWAAEVLSGIFAGVVTAPSDVRGRVDLGLDFSGLIEIIRAALLATVEGCRTLEVPATAWKFVGPTQYELKVNVNELTRVDLGLTAAADPSFGLALVEIFEAIGRGSFRRKGQAAEHL